MVRIPVIACGVMFVVMVMASAPASAQTAPPSRSPDPCQPIGRTEDGKLVYPLKCNNIPAPPKPASAADASSPAPVPEEEDKGGLFGRAPSFIRPTADPRAAGTGPSQPR